MTDLRMFGTELNIIKKTEDEVTHYFTVDEIYQYQVKCHDEEGRIECFGIGDLVTLGALGTNHQAYENAVKGIKI